MIDLFGLVGKISIHAPRTGSDGVCSTDARFLAISIHAPRTGSDDGVCAGRCVGQHFNPRSPHGERRQTTASRQMQDSISIHAPRTGSDVLQSRFADHASFQSTLPARGATASSNRALQTMRHFNPRSPHGERRSIRDGTSADRRFQSTLPARGATPAHPLHVFGGRHFNPRSPHGERLPDGERTRPVFD